MPGSSGTHGCASRGTLGPSPPPIIPSLPSDLCPCLGSGTPEWTLFLPWGRGSRFVKRVHNRNAWTDGQGGPSRADLGFRTSPSGGTVCGLGAPAGCVPWSPQVQCSPLPTGTPHLPVLAQTRPKMDKVRGSSAQGAPGTRSGCCRVRATGEALSCLCPAWGDRRGSRPR